jgi:hypothetical protein
MILHDEYSVVYGSSTMRVRMRSKSYLTIAEAENFVPPPHEQIIRIEHRSVTAWEPIDE